MVPTGYAVAEGRPHNARVLIKGDPETLGKFVSNSRSMATDWLAAWASSRLVVCRQESINFGAPQTEVATSSAVVLPQLESPK